MLSIAERHKHILDKLNAQGFVKVLDIARELDVTPVTIRKDLKLLEEKKLLFRTHGSASPVNPHTADINIHIKERINSDAKRRIAHTAIRLLDPNDSIIVASGSTVYAFAEEITDDLNLTVVTASLNVSTLLNRFEHIHVIQLGGTLRKSSFSVIGDLAAQAFDNLTCSKLFMGVDGIDLDFGLTTSNIDEARLNQRMIAASLRTIVLADSSKFGKRGFGKICTLDQVDVIITDSGISPSVAKSIEEAGIELIIAQKPKKKRKKRGGEFFPRPFCLSPNLKFHINKEKTCFTRRKQVFHQR